MSDKSSDWQNAFEQECVKHANSVLYMQKKIEELKVFNARLFSDNGELEEKLQAAEEKIRELESRDINRMFSKAMSSLAHSGPELEESQEKIEKLAREKGDMRIEIQEVRRKLQAAEENLAECGHKYWKEVEKRKAAEERERILREAVEFYKWATISDLEENDMIQLRSKPNIWANGKRARQALEKVKRGGE